MQTCGKWRFVIGLIYPMTPFIGVRFRAERDVIKAEGLKALIRSL
ncbi:MAG: hypothetical protein OJF50_003914 [Nitrospira sp.]|jgi:hypothetical protein|nr:hypothetical protein [Nitrospira sp.]